MKSTIILAIILLITAVYAEDKCSVTIIAKARSGSSSSWTTNGVLHTIYDIRAKNTGSCPIYSMKSYFYSDGYTLNPSWNYNNITGKIELGYSSLAPNGEFDGAGFIVTGPNAPSQLYIKADCGRVCGTYYNNMGTVAATSKATTQAATQEPTIAPVDQCGGCQQNQVCVNIQGGYKCQYRNCGDTVCPANQRSVCINDGGVARCIATGSTQCLAQAVVKARNGGEFDDNGVKSQIYDVIVSGYSVSDVTIEIDPFPSSVSQTWNIDRQAGSSDQYTLRAHGTLSSSAQSAYYGAGFVLRNITGNENYAPKVGVLLPCAGL